MGRVKWAKRVTIRMEERFSRMNRNVPVVLCKVSQPGVQWGLDHYRKIDGVNPKS
jgi:hypothetical protein